MPYSKLSEAHLRELDGAPLTLAQANLIAHWADRIGGKFGWPTAINQFKKTHSKVNGHWTESSKKELSQDVMVEKEADGRYLIKSISTVALPDQEDETFTTKAMDEEIAYHKANGEYPEYRLFHNRFLGIGQVEKMYRIGIFAYDEGHSYTDPFSLDVCEKMLVNNDGKWRNSRGFYAHEVQGQCPECNSKLGITIKHMMVGYKCPNCQVTLAGFKGVLKHVHFTKTRTFDVTVTDHPCVLFTGVQAFRPDSTSFMEETMAMNKEELKKKLLAAGMDEKAVEERLAKFSEDQLKELKLDDVPDAVLLKAFESEAEEPATESEPQDAPATNKDGEQGDAPAYVLDKSVLETIAATVKQTVTETVTAVLKDMLGNLEIDIPELKETDEFKALQADVAEIKQLITAKTQEQLKTLLKETPRSGQLRILRFKSTDPAPEPPAPAKTEEPQETDGAVIRGADGEAAATMTEFMLGKQ